MRKILSGIIVIAFYSFVNAQAPTKAIDEAMVLQDYEKAITLAKSCYENDTTEIECLSKLASASYRSGDQANAKKYLHLLEKSDSTEVEVFIQLASIYEQQLQNAKAIKYYSIVNKMLPENPIYFRKNANLYRSYGEKAEAFRLYAIANKLNPRDVLALKGLAELTLSNGQFSMADSIIRTSLVLDSMNINMNYLMARSKYKQKQYDSVTLVFHRIRGHVDLNSYYNKMLGYAYLQIDSVDFAINKLRLALVDEEDSEKLHYYLATAYEKKENMEGAMEHYEKAVEYAISPDLDLYHRNVGRLASKENDLKKAIDAYKDAYKYSEDPVLLYYLATSSDLYYKDKNIAIRYYTKYLASDSKHSEYIEYAKKRNRYLKELAHQKTKG